MIFDENLNNRYGKAVRKPQYRGLTTGSAARNKVKSHWVYGIPCVLPNENGKYPSKVNGIRTVDGSIFPVYPSTVSEYTGCDDCKGTPIYEGDIVNKNKNYVRWVQYSERYGAYITISKNECGNYNTDYLAKGDTLCRHIEVLGNLWQNPELLKQHCYTEYSLEEVYKD